MIPDAVMLSYDEPLADKLHARLQRVLGVQAKRLHGVRGMRRAYQLSAELVDREVFFLADGDFVIATEFDITAVEPLADDVSMRVWRARNPLNGLIYGYGGLKLIRRSALRDLGHAIDVLAALPGRVDFTSEIAGTTRCNQSPYHAWKAAFRECAMLARGSEYGMSDQGKADRITAWKGCDRGDFAQYAVSGAREGVAFAADFARCPHEFDQLNDPDWLQARFMAAHGEQAVVG
ncbi:hypothetical protein [Streptacidiphilus rugosus]|uniref:hypothetical protein n=1 Tax=Streptacidiphilus rugosus TaxID=405783 RepID=UPI000A4D7743|nr:hypothetical protein [Streptacidiphilus rugosus]